MGVTVVYYVCLHWSLNRYVPYSRNQTAGATITPRPSITPLQPIQQEPLTPTSQIGTGSVAQNAAAETRIEVQNFDASNWLV